MYPPIHGPSPDRRTHSSPNLLFKRGARVVSKSNKPLPLTFCWRMSTRGTNAKFRAPALPGCQFGNKKNKIRHWSSRRDVPVSERFRVEMSCLAPPMPKNRSRSKTTPRLPELLELQLCLSFHLVAPQLWPIGNPVFPTPYTAARSERDPRDYFVSA